MQDYYSVRWEDGIVKMLDQRLLPGEIVYLKYVNAVTVADAIKQMVIRGAPAIGIAAGYGLALDAVHSKSQGSSELIRELGAATEILRNSRPTAVNLAWALDRIMKIVNDQPEMDPDHIRQIVVAEAIKIHEEDVEMNRKMGMYGQQFIPDGGNVIHHCNTGALATGGYGTALGVIRTAFESGKKIHVYVDETRPRLQGARITSWELKQLGIPHTVIVDGASGHIMRHHKIDACLVGCDRIASNGDVANKIGTYNLALVANAHGVPFYSAGPTSTIDLTIASGKEIPIEDRPEREVTNIGNEQITPDEVQVSNPAFDVTPAQHITGIITNRGVAFPPYKESLARVMSEDADD